MWRRARLLAGAVFGAAALLTGRRATHALGVGAAGRFRVVAEPEFPPHPWLRAGQAFDAVVRHANLEATDDCAMDLRSATLRLTHPDGSRLDLPMNTGECSLFRDLEVFVDFLRARPRGAAGFAWMARRWPREWAAGAAGWRLGPSSYARLRYHTQVPLRFRGDDGHVGWIRYRLTPADGAPEDGIPEAERLRHPISLARRPTDDRPPDALRAELRARLRAGPVRWRLEAQLHRPSPTDPPGWADASLPWDLPWVRIGDLALDRALPDADTEALRFDLANAPASLGVLPAAGSADPHAVAWLRTRIYPWSQALRARRRRAPEPVGRASGGAGGERREAVGRLLFEAPAADGRDRGLHAVAVALWDRDPLGRADFLGRATTDGDGRFRIAYDPADAGPGDDPDLELRVLDGERVVAVFAGADDVTAATYDFGELRVAFWSWLPGPLARLAVPPGEAPPEDFAPGRRPLLLRNLARSAGVRARHALACAVDPGALSLDRVQADYPPGPLAAAEAAEPGVTGTDRWFVERLLDGFSPARFEDRGDGALTVAYSFRGDRSNGRYDLPEAVARFRRDGDRLVPLEIALQARLPGHDEPHGPLADPVVVRPGDGDRWVGARRTFTSAHLLAGQIDGHLCRAHLDVEQHAVAVFRNLRRSPLRAILAPHLKEVATINWQGAAWVYGPAGIVPKVSGFTPEAVAARFVDQMGRVDWCGFAPPAAVVPGHRWPRVAAAYWALLGDWLGEALARHRDAIAAGWGEVAAWSEDLAHASAPFTGDPDAPAPPLALPRVRVHGVEKAVRPFVAGSRPGDDDWERLLAVCRYAVFRATLWHTWINDLQLVDGGDVRVGSLGRRRGGLGDDATCGPLPADASEQLWMVPVLVHTNWGRVLADEEGDVDPGLVARVRAAGPAFAALGFDVAGLRSRVNI